MAHLKRCGKTLGHFWLKTNKSGDKALKEKELRLPMEVIADAHSRGKCVTVSELSKRQKPAAFLIPK